MEVLKLENYEHKKSTIPVRVQCSANFVSSDEYYNEILIFL